MQTVTSMINDTAKRQIIKYRRGEKIETEDIVVSETHILITLQCETIGSLTCSPSNLHDLAAGYLLSSGVVRKDNRLIHLEYIEDQRKFDITLENNNILRQKEYSVLKPLGCGAGDMLFIRVENEHEYYAPEQISSEEISELMKQFNRSSELYQATGGVHSCAIADKSGIIVFREDIGRHNAVDKVIGNLYLNKIDLNEKILLTSGRISSEVVMKSINAGLGMIISRSAPTETGIILAEQKGLTVVGFARNKNFNVYCNPHRIVFEIER